MIKKTLFVSFEQICKIIFNEPTYTSHTKLEVSGEVKVFPDLSDATKKLENLSTLVSKTANVKSIQKADLSVFRRIQNLVINIRAHNGVATDVFETLYFSSARFDLLPDGSFRNNQKLEKINLRFNVLKVLHRDTFLDVHNLKEFDLSWNNLEIIPDGLFRNNESDFGLVLIT